MKVKDVYCPDLASVSEYMTIRTVIRLLLLSHSYAIPVVNTDNQYVSCIDISDIIDACVPAYMKSLLRTGFLPDINRFYDNLAAIQGKKVGEYLPRDYPALNPQDTIQYAADLMEKSKRQMLPVIDRGQLLGTLSRLEIVAAILKKEATSV